MFQGGGIERGGEKARREGCGPLDVLTNYKV